MPAAVARRLPGIRFEPRAAQLPEALPRMDVAAFVGFAASGPLHTPVAVEDMAQFSAIFGAAPVLAWDKQRGEPARARLASSVRTFFANGGRRCWIVRVAGEQAAYTYFSLPGVLVSTTDGLQPAFARARSQGSWSDGLRVSTGARVRAVQAAAGYSGTQELFLTSGSARPVDGDVLRLVFGGERYMLFAAADLTRPTLTSPPSDTVGVRLIGAQWFVPFGPASSPVGWLDVEARVYGAMQHLPPVAGDVRPTRADEAHPFEHRVAGRIDTAQFADAAREPGRLELLLSVPAADAPEPGALVRLDASGEEAWLLVEGLGLGEDWSSPPGDAVKVTGRAWRRLGHAPVTLPALSRAEIVTFDLRAQEGERSAFTLRDLGLAPAHPRYWNGLVTDDVFFAPRDEAPPSAGPVRSAELERDWPEATPGTPRYPLAGAQGADGMFIPLALPGFDTPLPAVRNPRSALERDGLDVFDANLFLDPGMREPGVDQVMAQADLLRYLGPAPRPLKGVHAVLGFGGSAISEEATIIAVPDAIHAGWRAGQTPPVQDAVPLPPLPRPAWWHGLPCDGALPVPLVAEPDFSQFLSCGIRRIDAPELEIQSGPDATGTFRLIWSAPEPGGLYVLEESTLAAFIDLNRVYAGPGQELTLYSRSPGDYFYRVRVEVGENGSDWSNVRSVRIGGAPGWEVRSHEDYEDRTLLAVHRALLRMSAARGDLLAVLSLPSHYRERETIAHTGLLTSLAQDTAGLDPVRPLDASEERALSYGALYHPWLIARDGEGVLEELPPDGVACGVLAARAIARGAWVAPANEPLLGPVALTPPLKRQSLQALQDAQVNVVRQEPRGFLVLSEDTLSLDADLRPINVRRLLMLLRRLALRRGATYVFEPLNDVFRRSVQRGFEEVLFELFQRGAFAGATPAASYQVVTGPSVNPPQSLDLGRFFVELRVAPSLPLRFISVRLLHSGERLTVEEVR